MKNQIAHTVRNGILGLLCSLVMAPCILAKDVDVKAESQFSEVLNKIERNRDNEKEMGKLLPIVHCSFKPSKYEQILISQLRNSETSMKQFRLVSEKVGDLLVSKVVACLPSKTINIDTPVTQCKGEVLADHVELVSIMRSGDALLDTFMKHFPDANISKFLIQRDEQTAEPHFKYMKISSEIASAPRRAPDCGHARTP